MKLIILLLFFAIPAFVLVFAATFSPAFAFDYEPPLQDVAQEKAAQDLFAEVRCLTCDGESLAGSSADFSVSMRALIREQIAQGKSKNEVLEYLTQRYGVGILQTPPKSGGALWLWLSPLLLLLFGATLIIKRRAR